MKIFSTIIILLIGLLLTAAPVHAVCPVCTVVVAGGVGISRWLGIDDTITGVWIGGFILSAGLWMSDWIKKRKKIPYSDILAVLFSFILTVPPLYMIKMIGIRGNTLWGIDKIVFGICAGAILFIAADQTNKWLKSRNGGNVYIYYQKVILPVSYLTLASLAFYLYHAK